MDSPSTVLSRSDTRYNHITIRLQYLYQDRWSFSEAREWSQLGFNFFAEHALPPGRVCLKRGLNHFEGQIVWQLGQTGDQAVQATLVNELIFKRAQQKGCDPVLHQRLLRLIRVDGMVAEKRAILASLGLDIGLHKWDELVARRQLERPLNHYGVRVDSPAWQTLTAQALRLSSVVLNLEQWSQSLKEAARGRIPAGA